jgi:phage shock protein PspC (stress-responsive transcriptional regulator)
MVKRFLRNSRDKIMGGVCSGIADYVGADVTLIRLITLLGIIASGVLPGLFIYLVCVIIVPLDSNTDWKRNGSGEFYSGTQNSQEYQSENRNEETSKNTRYVIGICMVIIGGFLIARMFFGWIKWEYVFAATLIIGGLYMIFGNRRNDG